MVELVTVRLAELVNARIERWLSCSDVTLLLQCAALHIGPVLNHRGTLGWGWLSARPRAPAALTNVILDRSHETDLGTF
jgi:hypothetical protein